MKRVAAVTVACILLASMIAACGMDVTVNVVEEKNWVAFVGRKR